VRKDGIRKSSFEKYHATVISRRNHPWILSWYTDFNKGLGTT
jgi:hypothetical protein